jgi:hypothetical protein
MTLTAVLRTLPFPTIPTIFGVDFNITLLSAILLATSKQVYKWFVLNYCNWPEHLEATQETIASCVSITHSTLLLYPLWTLITQHRLDPCATIKDAPSVLWYNDAMTLMEWCSGYMLQDFLLILMKDYNPGSSSKFFPFVLPGEDPLFLLHHIATFSYMTMARKLKAGHLSAMLLMFFGGEFSSSLSPKHFHVF